MDQDDEHPFYWEKDGEPVLLLGATDDDNLFQWPREKLIEHLNTLVDAGGNYVRNTMSDRENKGFEVYPFQEVEPGTYDLTRWNPEYWSRFQAFLQATADRDIVVQIEVWDCWDAANSPFDSSNYWDPHPYNPRNNVNYTHEETGLPGAWHHHPMSKDHPFYLAPPPLDDIPEVFQFQKRFVKELLSYTLEHDHVLYTVCNETRLPERFSTFWARFFHETAEKDIYVSDMRGRESTEPVLDHPDLFTYAELSQSGELHGQLHYEAVRREREPVIDSPVPLNVVKQYGTDEKNGEFFGGEEEVLRKFWRCLFAGCASFRFHRPTFGIGLCDRSKRMIRSARMLADRVTLPTFEPAEDILSNRAVDEAYAMQGEDDQVLVYFTDGGTVSLAGDGDRTEEWLDVDQCEWSDRGGIDRDGELSAPGAGQWVAVIG